jgi:hypothetical protein
MTERDLFIAARRLGDPAARAAFLDGACAGDAGLRRHRPEPEDEYDSNPIASASRLQGSRRRVVGIARGAGDGR